MSLPTGHVYRYRIDRVVHFLGVLPRDSVKLVIISVIPFNRCPPEV